MPTQTFTYTFYKISLYVTNQTMKNKQTSSKSKLNILKLANEK